MKVECYGASRPQQDRKRNEDAFVVIRGDILFAAVCDGAGNAEQAAKRVLRLFELYVREATLKKALDSKTWTNWVRQLDSALLGGNESTFLGIALVGNQVVGASVGDSQAYLVGFEGGFQFLTSSANKARLGSGNAKPLMFRANLQPRDVLLLMTDGAWTPLGPYIIEKTVRATFMKHFSDVSVAVLDAAGRTGRWDDMTVVALRLVGR